MVEPFQKALQVWLMFTLAVSWEVSQARVIQPRAISLARLTW
jgi:hypothetical protein